MSLRLGRPLLLGFAIGAAQCGGAVDSSPCEGPAGPLIVTMPDGAMKNLTYGTAVVVVSKWLDVFITAKPNACPADWITKFAPAPSDIDALWLDITIPTNDSFLATYTLDPSGTYASSPGDAVVSAGTFPAGAPWDVNTWNGKLAFGTVTIGYMDDVHVTGSIDAQFFDGEAVKTTFDIPFCTSECSVN
jgi:hypothetical protein